MILAIVFDFDGVIADTERLHLTSMQQALASMGWSMSAGEYYDTYLGYTDRDLLLQFAGRNGRALGADELDLLLAAKAAAYDAAMTAADVLFDEAEATIRALAGAFRHGIASGARRSEIQAILDTRAGLSQVFETIVSADDDVAGKPSPEPYLEAVRRLGVNASAAVAVEDSPWGLAAAKAAGLRTIAVTSSYGADALAADVVVPAIGAVNVDLVRSLAAPDATRP
jgi:HAD superfamily hydrolase (TIGR01509 family)